MFRTKGNKFQAVESSGTSIKSRSCLIDKMIDVLNRGKMRMDNRNFSALTDEELLEVYEKRETEPESDFQALLSEIAKRWAEKEKNQTASIKTRR